MEINMIKAILAVDSKFGIGKNNELPWHFSEDMQYFKEQTTNDCIVMGNNTWLSLNCKPLPNRMNVVITHSYDSVAHKDADMVITSDMLYCNFGINLRHNDTLETCIANVAAIMDCRRIDTTWIIGGASLFTQTMHMVDELHLTMINGDYECDRFYNPFEYDVTKFKLTEHKALVNKDGKHTISVGVYNGTSPV